MKRHPTHRSTAVAWAFLLTWAFAATLWISTAPAQTPGESRPTLSLRPAQRPVPHHPFTIPGLALQLVYVPPARFTMKADGEQHAPVELTRGYWIGKTEVTQREWQQVMGTNHSRHRGDTLPVDSVTYAEALAFCRELTRRERAAGRLPTNHVYSLPTEAQWDGAAHGPGNRILPSAEADAWQAGNSGLAPHPVGLKPANPLGLHDAQGNVWEWCRDYHSRLPNRLAVDPKGPESGQARVIRGGSWIDRIHEDGKRAGLPPETRSQVVGFRVALVPDPNPILSSLY